MHAPFYLLKEWLEKEKQIGILDPQQAVLSTVTHDAKPHARVVAIREITENELIFFTQRGTRKVAEIKGNPNVCLTFWFEHYQREVIIEGTAKELSAQENQQYWQNYPKEAQIRFYAYSPTSGLCIPAKSILEEKRTQIQQDFLEKPLPISLLYCGFALLPHRFIFYHYRTDELSDVINYALDTQYGWQKSILSP